MLTFDRNIDYYSILEVTNDATSVQVKKSYLKLALKHHPDKGGDAENFKSIANAYEILMDEETRAYYDCLLTNSTPAKSKPSNSAKNGTATSEVPLQQESGLVFNVIPSDVPLAECTSLIIRTQTTYKTSNELKADDMSSDELYSLAMNNQTVAMSISQNIALLNKLKERLLNNKLWDIAQKYPTFAYQVLSHPSNRDYLCYGVTSFRLVSLFKKDYQLLLLISASSELTQKLLYREDKPMVSGSELYDIYNFFIETQGQAQAFISLLDLNPLLFKLFNNIAQLQSGNIEFSMHQFEMLNAKELTKLAQQHLFVAKKIIESDTLLGKFINFNQSNLIEILCIHPDQLINDFFKEPRNFYFDRYAHYDILSACKKHESFLVHIISSPEIDLLSGFDLEQLIETNPDYKTLIYINSSLKTKYVAYKALTNLLTSQNESLHHLSNDEVYALYQPIFEKMPSFDEHQLFHVIEHLARTNDHKLLAHHAVLIIECYQWNSALSDLPFISETFFDMVYANDYLKSSCYRLAESYCKKYFSAFEQLLNDPLALSCIKDDFLYDLQQQWFSQIECQNKVRDIFKNQPLLRQKWQRGLQIKHLQKGASILHYEEQIKLDVDAPHVKNLRKKLSTIKENLTFNQIALDETNIAFLLQLANDTDKVKQVLNLAPALSEKLLPGVMWFLVLSHTPEIVNNLALSLNIFISLQLNKLLNDSNEGKIIGPDWLISNNDTEISTEISKEVKTTEDIFENIFGLLDELQKTLEGFKVQKIKGSIVRLRTACEQESAWLAIFENAILAETVLPSSNTCSIDTLIGFLSDPQNIDVIRQSTELQHYVSAHNEKKTFRKDINKLIDSLCKQGLLGDALTIFSLVHESQLMDDLDSPIKLSMARKITNNGLTGIFAGLALISSSISLAMLFSKSDPIHLATSITIATASIYQTFKSRNSLTYREVLSKNNIGLFFSDEKEFTGDSHSPTFAR